MKNQYILVMTVLFSGLVYKVDAQTNYKVSDSKSNDMKLSGTSSLHDWEMKAHTFTGEAQFEFKDGDNQQLSGLNSLSFSLPVDNLKSKKSGLDKNAYKALKRDQHKDISYKLLTATISPDKKGHIETLGELTIAGVAKEVSIDVSCTVNKDATISCFGSEKLVMSDYQIKPPTFMMGAMSTGDDVTLNFTVVFKK